MPEEPLIDETLHDPWLLAVWPGMGHVALSAGYFLMAKLGMHVLGEFSSSELFDSEHVEVEEGMIQPARLPRSRLFLYRDPQSRHDLVLFIGEAQPPMGKRVFCRTLLNVAKNLGVRRVFTFAAMATPMHPEKTSRVFVAATEDKLLAELQELEDVTTLEEGRISGLNGVILGEAAEAGLCGACLLGEMPHIFAQLPFPGASLAVLRVFRALAGINIELSELQNQAEQLAEQLGQVLAQVEGQLEEAQGEEPEEAWEVEAPPPEPKLSPDDERQIEELFREAQKKRSKAYELKQLLDRLDVFLDYEDRFLDLFKKPEP